MFTGLILKESLENVDVLHDHRITITKEESWNVGKRAVNWQPKIWTAIYVEGLEADMAEFAVTVSHSILNKWYANLSDSNSEYVIFHKKIFTYPREDNETKQKAQHYGKSMGVPDHQLDW